MSADPTLEELLEVQSYFRLPSPALVEKDFYVVKALAAIAAVERDALHVRLAFGGGTALSRAHRLIRRASTHEGRGLRPRVSRPGAPDGGGPTVRTEEEFRIQIPGLVLVPSKSGYSASARIHRASMNGHSHDEHRTAPPRKH